MPSVIQLKTGTGSAVPSALAQGEVAINIDNGLMDNRLSNDKLSNNESVSPDISETLLFDYDVVEDIM